MDTKPLSPEDFSRCPLPIGEHDTIQLGHGAGGRMMQRLIAELFRWAFDNESLNTLDDMAVVTVKGNRLAVSTDSFVVDPLFFPGGNIGELSVYGTVNDVAMSGARPLYLTAGFIIEEGMPLAELKRIVLSMRDAARKAGVQIITGDTKVVHKGKGDKLFINTTGIGVIEHPYRISGSALRSGDKVILSGTIAEHGMAVLSQREGLQFDLPVLSDAAPLYDLVQTMLAAGGEAVHALRDATRGGVAAVLNEFATSSRVGIRVEETAIPVVPAVAGACGLLGLDPLYVANEGKLVAVVSPEKADAVLSAMHAHPLGVNAVRIGEVSADSSSLVSLRTALGTWRILDVPLTEQLPRIC